MPSYYKYFKIYIGILSWHIVEFYIWIWGCDRNFPIWKILFNLAKKNIILTKKSDRELYGLMENGGIKIQKISGVGKFT